MTAGVHGCCAGRLQCCKLLGSTRATAQRHVRAVLQSMPRHPGTRWPSVVRRRAGSWRGSLAGMGSRQSRRWRPRRRQLCRWARPSRCRTPARPNSRQGGLLGGCATLRSACYIRRRPSCRFLGQQSTHPPLAHLTATLCALRPSLPATGLAAAPVHSVHCQRHAAATPRGAGRHRAAPAAAAGATGAAGAGRGHGARGAAGGAAGGG